MDDDSASDTASEGSVVSAAESVVSVAELRMRPPTETAALVTLPPEAPAVVDVLDLVPDADMVLLATDPKTGSCWIAHALTGEVQPLPDRLAEYQLCRHADGFAFLQPCSFAFLLDAPGAAPGDSFWASDIITQNLFRDAQGKQFFEVPAAAPGPAGPTCSYML